MTWMSKHPLIMGTGEGGGREGNREMMVMEKEWPKERKVKEEESGEGEEGRGMRRRGSRVEFQEV